MRIEIHITDGDGETVISRNMPFTSMDDIDALAGIVRRQFERELKENANLIKEDE